MKSALRMLRWPVSGLVAITALYLLLLAMPYPLFAYETQYENITVYSDRLIPPEIIGVLQDAESRLEKSPLYDRTVRHPVFICNDRWRFTLFAHVHYKVGGVTYGVFNTVFLRPTDIVQNRLISYSGRPVGTDRPLSYFIAHEITHAVETHFLGGWRESRLPVWKREGYADVVGRDGDFNFRDQLPAFRRGDPSMDPAASGLYLKYALECQYLMTVQAISAEDLLTRNFDEGTIDRELER